MPAISTNWNTIQTLPASTAPIIQRGWITLLLLEPIAGQERRILPRCTLCNQSFAQIPASMHSRTSNWLGHIRTKHPEQAEELNQHQASSSIGSSSVPQPQITPFTLNQRIPTNQDIRDLVRDLVVSCNLPIRMVDSAACQKLIQATRAPGAINRAIIGQEITSAYENRQIEIMSTLSYHIEQGIRFTLCIDCWTSQSQHAFLGVSIHYINRDWQQESFLLALADLRRRHTGVYLCRTLNKVLAVYGISQSILAITKDNASNNQTLMDAFQTEYTRSANQSVYSIPCVDHILNLVCQDILKKLKASTSESEIQEVAAETYFQDNEEAESEARDLELGYRQPIKRRRVSHAQKNRRTKIAPENLNCWAKIRWITGKLRQQQHLIRCLQRYITRFTADGTKMIRPVLDVPTRWNSFYHMIRNFSQSRRAIEAVMRRYPRDFTNLQITDSDWLIIHDVRKILGSIAALSEFFEGSRSYPTLSSALPMIGRLFGILENAIQLDNQKKSLKEAYLAGREKLEKYFPRIPDLSDRTFQAHVIATILDPRFKLQGLRGPQWTEQRLVRAEQRIRVEYLSYQRQYEQLAPQEAFPLEENSPPRRFAALEAEIYGTYEGEANEVTRYLAEPRVSPAVNPLDWWKTAPYGALRLMAQNYQSILASSAALEGQFSQTGDTANPRKRNRLSKVRINQLACLKSWNKVLLTVDPESDESEGSDFPISVLGDQSESSNESELSD